jgi:hypothetical protein
MNEEPDRYCEKILMTLMLSDEKIRFNKLYERLKNANANMSKPTLIQHLNHLIEEEIIQRHQEDKQKVSYEMNWKRFKELQKAKKLNQTALHQIKSEKIFKSKSLFQQTIYTTAMVTIGELYYLKLNILDILEPENKLANHFSYSLIRRLFNLYATWLYESAKESKENSQKIIRSLDRNINTLEKSFFDHPFNWNIFPYREQTQPATSSET